jgi:hypothetical protein
MIPLPKVSNPFTSGKRIAEREAEVLRLAAEDRERRDATRTAAWGSQARANDIGKELGRSSAKPPANASLADRARFQFEQDSDEDNDDKEIDNNVSELHGAASSKFQSSSH